MAGLRWIHLQGCCVCSGVRRHLHEHNSCPCVIHLQQPRSTKAALPSSATSAAQPHRHYPNTSDALCSEYSPPIIINTLTVPLSSAYLEALHQCVASLVSMAHTCPPWLPYHACKEPAWPVPCCMKASLKRIALHQLCVNCKRVCKCSSPLP